MKLCLRGQDIAWMSVGLLSPKGEIVKMKRMDARPETILSEFWKTVHTWKMDWNDVEALGVVAGPGSFTALRQSLTIVNSIAFVRSLKVSSIQAKPTETDKSVMQRLGKARSTKQIVTPFYGAPAMITKPS